MSASPTGLHGISLRTLLPKAEFHGVDDIRIESCSCDSRRCRAGDLFVALKGSRQDGHDFIAHAARQGASAVLTERRDRDCPLPACIVPDSAAAFGRVCQALAGQPSDRLKVVGITGTNGKTTASFLAASVLSAGGYNAGILGTLGYFDGADTHRASHTTPPAPVLANWLARCESNGCSHAVMEVSSHALVQSRVAGIQFDIACFTNIRHDHLDFHGTRADYREAKARLLDHLSSEGIAIFNADDPGSASLVECAQGPSLTIGIDSAAEITATLLEQTISEQTFLLCSGRDAVPVRTPLIGTHNVYNCLMAAAVGIAYGFDITTIARGLEGIGYVPGRLERIECGQPFGVFVDYAHTPDALTGVLAALRDVTRGRLLCVFGAGGDRDRSKRPLMGRAVEQAADVAIVTSDNPRGESPLKIIDDVLSGFEDRFHPRAIVDRGEAIAWALSQARAGDCVLIAGKGHEDYQQIGEKRVEFDDREQARQWLYRNTPAQPVLRAA
jgi:UDP-N-acetylmuramoyl-L-alanyl-D-glutamate--2,6-diaminopimelate ligase